MSPPTWRSAASRGFTLLELLVTLALIGLLAALLLPALSRAKARSRQVACLGNLRQVGIAFHVFAHEHGGQFPQAVSTNGGGALEASATPEPWWNVILPSAAPFLAVSNELGNLRVLQCPAARRLAPSEASGTVRTPDFAAVAGAVWGDPTRALALDRNVDRLRTRRTTNGGGALEIVWTPERHSGRGNVLWGDGHVEGVRRASITATGSQNGTGGGADPGTSGSGAGSGSGSGPVGSGGRAGGSVGGSAGGAGGGTVAGGSLATSARSPSGSGSQAHPQGAVAGTVPATAFPATPSRQVSAAHASGEQEVLDRIQRRIQFGLLALILACMIAGLLVVLAHAWNRYRALSS